MELTGNEGFFQNNSQQTKRYPNRELSKDIILLNYLTEFSFKSERRDLNPRPPLPQSGALPSCATPRIAFAVTYYSTISEKMGSPLKKLSALARLQPILSRHLETNFPRIAARN